jgi:hypothetical protein
MSFSSFFGEVEQVVLLNIHSFSGSKKMDKSNVSDFSFMCLHLNYWI